MTTSPRRISAARTAPLGRECLSVGLIVGLGQVCITGGRSNFDHQPGPVDESAARCLCCGWMQGWSGVDGPVEDSDGLGAMRAQVGADWVGRAEHHTASNPPPTAGFRLKAMREA